MKKQKEIFKYVIGGVILAGFVFLIGYLNFMLPEIQTTIKFNDAFIMVVTLIIGYYWGSSQGSSDKTDQMGGS